MDSGIYKITFYDGCYYLGKSENIPQRWKTHAKNFEKRTHTKKMQAAYDRCGEPQYEVVLPVHTDHIDLYESALITLHWGPQLLNTTKPRPMSVQECEHFLQLYDAVTLEGHSIMLYSTASHVEALQDLHNKNQELQDDCAEANLRIEQLESKGILLPQEHEDRLYQLQRQNREYKTELTRLKDLDWWDRLFNYKVYV